MGRNSSWCDLIGPGVHRTRVRSTSVALALSYVVAQFLPGGLIHKITSDGKRDSNHKYRGYITLAGVLMKLVGVIIKLY